jgi:hypothetical protein
MAIVVEEEKKGGVGILSVLTWLVIMGAIGGVVYYIFFEQPQLIGQISTPINLQNTQQLSQINFSSKDILQNPAFQNLKQYITPIQPTGAGRSNPFLGF